MLKASFSYDSSTTCPSTVRVYPPPDNLSIQKIFPKYGVRNSRLLRPERIWHNDLTYPLPLKFLISRRYGDCGKHSLVWYNSQFSNPSCVRMLLPSSTLMISHRMSPLKTSQSKVYQRKERKGNWLARGWKTSPLWTTIIIVDWHLRSITSQ